ncbi:hypothetical protein MNBD_PLANCTO02-767 [hydrothermal vent metagenome]|uniref:DUF1549 domain-containing protein n=1 Tax=hydrothermal vent metagenome TaxID=652676 RepID=A0A3B1E923_9ZZZZ
MSEKQISYSKWFSSKVMIYGLCCLLATLFAVLSALPETEAAQRRRRPPRRRTSKKKKPSKKKEKPLPPRFMVKSKSVLPSRLMSAIISAQKIDKMVEANYAKYKVTPNPLTSDEQFVRRIYLDIAGRIPTYPETRIFIGSRKPRKRRELIDKLLNSDEYASHSYNYWADILRYTDRLNNSTHGEPYRQWIKQSLAENKPWDKMVTEMITAKGLIWEDPASGFLQRDSGMPLDNMNNIVRIFLGTRIGCAQCHDHPFDRWTQKEFYQMAAYTYGARTNASPNDKRFFKKNPSKRLKEEYYEIDQEEKIQRRNYYRMTQLIRYNLAIVNDNPRRKIRLPKNYQYNNAKPRQIIPPKTLFGDPAIIKKGESSRITFARWLTAKSNPRFAKTIANRLWKRAFGRGQIEPVDDMMDSTVAENPQLMKHLESEMKRLNFDMKEYLRIIFNTQTYQRQASVKATPLAELYHFPGPILRRMTAEQAWDSFLTLAVTKPNEYREFPANIRTEYISVDLNTTTPQNVLEGDDKSKKAVREGRRKKYKYKGVLLARASELPSPVKPSHFLRTFGQSDRELISSSSVSGSVPQVLFMFNGPITHMMLEKGSTMYKNVTKKKRVSGRVEVIFLSILNRKPTKDESRVALQEIKKNGSAGYGNVIWSLVNTREFLFVQ